MNSTDNCDVAARSLPASPAPRIPTRARRRGAVYIVVLLSTLIVAATGLAALQLSRIQNATASGGNSFIEARTIARSAIDIGMLKIRNDPLWRTNLGNGVWVNNQALGEGTYSLTATDPIDNDVANGDNHPVILTGSGTVDGATFKASVRLEVGPRSGSCLEVSMISGGDSTVDSATLTSDQTVTANGNYTGSGSSTVNANVEAMSGVAGGTYTKTTTNRATAREMPDPATAINYYLASGTAISYSDLPAWSQTEILTNTTFETNVTGWVATGGTATLARSLVRSKSGLYSLLVSGRSSNTAVAAQNIPVASLKSGNKYDLWIPIFPTSATTASATLTLTSSGSGTQTFATDNKSLSANVWADLRKTITPTWTGTLTQATVSITINSNNNYHLDDPSLRDVTYSDNTYVIDRQVLSPSVNPFGSQQTNPQGIYVINCGNKDVIVGHSRIVGTLVLVKPGAGSLIQGPVIWEPAVINYPALLTDTQLKIGFDSSAGLDEVTLNINFNPPGTPYPYAGGTSNTTLTESYPSKITGLLYTTKDWTFSGAPNIFGVVIADKTIKVNATSLNLNYGNTYLNDPPPGFELGGITMKVVPGTWQRSVN